MIWVDREVKKIKERNLPLEWVDDMKTPSGRIHVGALRGVVIHDLIYKVLLENKIKAEYTYVFDDHDPMDDIPSYLNYNQWEKYAGRQLYQIPSPVVGYKNYAQYYAQEFIEVFNQIGCRPKIIWASELYNSGKMNEVTKIILDAANEIRKIYYQITKTAKPDYWYPFNVRCEKCQKIGTTQVYRWDGHDVYYRCLPNQVKWAKGCGYEGKISPFNGNGKFPWKVDWATKWKVIGVTIEGAGKDHMSKGGSHDIASAIVEKVLKYKTPYPIAYEWFTVGGKKMSSSKGIGSSAKEISKILPPSLLRFLMVRQPINQHIDFNPYGETIPNLFDKFDQCFNAYFNKLEGKIPSGKQGEIILDFARIFELSYINPLPRKRMYLPRFRTIINLILEKKTNFINFFEGLKKDKLTKEEKNILEERIKYGKIFLEKYYQNHKKDLTNFQLTNQEKEFLGQLAKELKRISSDKLEKEVPSIIINNANLYSIEKKRAFSLVYLSLTNKPYGPKIIDLIKSIGIKKTIENLLKINH